MFSDKLYGNKQHSNYVSDGDLWNRWENSLQNNYHIFKDKFTYNASLLVLKLRVYSYSEFWYSFFYAMSILQAHTNNNMDHIISWLKQIPFEIMKEKFFFVFLNFPFAFCFG